MMIEVVDNEPQYIILLTRMSVLTGFRPQHL